MLVESKVVADRSSVNPGVVSVYIDGCLGPMAAGRVVRVCPVANEADLPDRPRRGAFTGDTDADVGVKADIAPLVPLCPCPCPCSFPNPLRLANFDRVFSRRVPNLRAGVPPAAVEAVMDLVPKDKVGPKSDGPVVRSSGKAYGTPLG
jgi:hypothetical protein